MGVRHLVVTGLGAAVVLTACGGGGDQTPGPTIHFVGNSTCPTDGSVGPYDPSPPHTNGTPVGTAIDEMPHTHVNPPTQVTYNHDPPTSGCHYNLGGGQGQLAAPVPAGTYNQEIPAEYWVHNLEHGYVVVLYNCPNNSCPGDFQTLLNWDKGLTPESGFTYAKVLVLPWHTMKVKFACVSWDWYLGMNTLDMTQVQAFYDNHKGQSPEGAMTP